MWLWRMKMPTQNFLRLLPLHDVDAEKCVWCSFGSWSLVIKIILCSGFEHEVCSRFWSWSSGEILKLRFGQYFAANAWLRLWGLILVKIMKLGLVKILRIKFSRNADVWLRFLSLCLVEILETKFEQDLCKNLWAQITSVVSQCLCSKASHNLILILWKGIKESYQIST